MKPCADTPYRTYADFLAPHFNGKIQKLSIDGGFSCPNRDGRLSHSGCAYCNNATFTPSYCLAGDPITLQLEKGKQFFRRKYPEMQFLAYFQAHTNTYAPLNVLRERYGEALSVSDIVGIVIATRPDCIAPDTLDYLTELSRRTFLLIEFGVETTDDALLRRLNRGHTFAQAQEAILRTAKRGIHTAAHLILGLPGQTRKQMLLEADRISRLPIEVLKLHQLQIVRNTALEREYAVSPALFVSLFSTPEQYATLVVDFLERLRPTIALERFTSQTPSDLLIAPRWGLKNHEFTALLNRAFHQRNTWQGRLYN